MTEKKVDKDRIHEGTVKVIDGGIKLTTAAIILAGLATIVTGGAASPLLIAAVATTATVTVVTSKSDIVEGVQDIYYGVKGEDKDSINPVRDTVFNGNQELYNAVEYGALVTMTEGIYLLQQTTPNPSKVQSSSNGNNNGTTVKQTNTINQGKEILENSVKDEGTLNTKNIFPKDPKEMLPDVPSNTTLKGNIKWEPNQNTRVQYHPGEEVKPGEIYNPRHHGPHYHVEIRNDPSKGWNNPGNTRKLEPEGYTTGSGTGLLPGEQFPK